MNDLSCLQEIEPGDESGATGSDRESAECNQVGGAECVANRRDDDEISYDKSKSTSNPSPKQKQRLTAICLQLVGDHATRMGSVPPARNDDKLVACRPILDQVS